MKKFPVQAMDSGVAVPARHKRSMSDSDKRITREKMDASVQSFHHVGMDMEEGSSQAETETRKRLSPHYDVKISLKKEIQQLEKCLKDQFVVRQALEKALQHKNSSIDASLDSYIPKPTKKLIREIAMLELEVVHLEQYLLSLYRRAFDQQLSSVSPIAVGELTEEPLVSKSAPFPGASSHDISFRKAAPVAQSSHILLPRKSSNNLPSEAYTVGNQEKRSRCIHRSHSSLVPHPLCSSRPSAKKLSRALGQSHTQPLSLVEHEHSFSSRVTSLADHLGTTIAEHIPETLNRLSEDMIRSMCAIYRKLRVYHVVHHGIVSSSSPSSSFSSMNTFSPCYTGELRSPCYKRDAIVDAWFKNSRCTERLKEFSGPYNLMVEVSSICKASRRCSDVQEMLHNYKLLVQRLETIDPGTMSDEEKIAFWINVHNSMMMHAHLEYGVPGSNVNKTSLLTKILYNIGGRMVNADIIQGSILGCRMHPSGQWLRALLSSSKAKIKDGDEWKSYAVGNAEPLVRFALSSGSHSDPAVRVYSSKRLFQLLEAAKTEYIHATVTIRKGHKILLPKLLDSFAKDSNLCTQELLDMIKYHLPESLRLMLDASSFRRTVEWAPHNFTFRYLLPKDFGNLK